ncbi:MAG: hypothetical protein HYR92_04465 [Burkholderiales bacterium]|nr:hypothetical protein [Burkholderiales bacterium]
MSQFQEISDFDDLYLRLHDIGCVIEFVTLQHKESNSITIDLHRQAALFGLEVLRKRVDTYFEDLLMMPEYLNRKRSDFFSVSINPNLIGNGIAVSVNDFLGPYCDIERRRLLMTGPIQRPQTYLYWFGDEEVPKNGLTSPPPGVEYGGLSGAYVDPPYGLSGTKEQRNALFFEIVDCLLMGLKPHVTIFKWNHDSSNYFDAGKEWWGCYFWTIQLGDSGKFVVIAASSTD